MRQFQIRYKNPADFNKKLASIKASCKEAQHGDILFYLSWSKDIKSELDFAISRIRSNFPDAIYYGNEASGNISDGRLSYGISVTCYAFEDESSQVELAWVEEGSALSSLQDLWNYCKTCEGLRAVELIPSISYLETLNIEGNVPDLDPDILIFGGASVNYDNHSFEADIIASGHERTKQGLAAILYFGDRVQFSSTYILGWKGLGNPMRITDCHGKTITQIDNQPAYSIYEKYLNLSVDDNDTLVFPLLVEENGIEFIRTPKIILPDKSMQMFADIPLGSLVRIAYGDKNTILNTLHVKAEEIAQFRPEAIKAFSCAARRLFWGDSEVSRETRILNEVAPVCGFYTGGEILRFGGHLKVMNQTLSIIAIREQDSERTKVLKPLHDNTPDKSLVSRLAYFVEKVSEEQKVAHKQIMKQQELMQEDMETILGMASEYLSLYYVHLSDQIFKVYSLDGVRLSDTKELLTHTTDIFELLHKFAMSSVHPDDRHLFLELNIDTVRPRLANTKRFTVRFRRDYGQGYQWSEMDVIKYEEKDQPANSIIIGFAERDKEIRQEMEQSQMMQKAYEAAEEANKSKTRFLFNMSHDIRTPMNAITGFTSMAKKNIEDSEKVTDYINKIEISSQQLLMLINQVLEMSRIESGKVELEEKPVDIRDNYRSLVTVLSEQAKTHGLEFHHSFTNVRHFHVLADPARMSQITLNLTGNAIKYTPQGGRIDYDFSEIPCPREGYARFSFTVSDTGIGMSEEFQKEIFEPFSRENSTTVSHIQGTGLGMSIVKSLVDLAGGTINVQSEIGKGSRFEVTIDFKISEAEAQATDASVQKPSNGNFQGHRVLLVEDNMLNREIARFLLEEQGLEVDEAEDGDVAVDIMKKHAAKGDYMHYDFILMDVQMPRMNGYEATARIREILAPAGTHVPIIALSANAFEEDRKKSCEVGMDAHIAKPVDIGELWSTLSQFVKQN